MWLIPIAGMFLGHWGGCSCRLGSWSHSWRSYHCYPASVTTSIPKMPSIAVELTVADCCQVTSIPTDAIPSACIHIASMVGTTKSSSSLAMDVPSSSLSSKVWGYGHFVVHGASHTKAKILQPSSKFWCTSDRHRCSLLNWL